MTMIELPVEWFDSPEPAELITNNEAAPTEQHWDDYAPFWHTAREWDYPHPDMEGYTCSKGWEHVARQRPPVPLVGLANVPVPRPQNLACHG